jgi:hypothetical protein
MGCDCSGVRTVDSARTRSTLNPAFTSIVGRLAFSGSSRAPMPPESRAPGQEGCQRKGPVTS